MERMIRHGASDRGIEATLRRERLIILAILVALVGLSWLYLIREAGNMERMMAGLGSMPMQPTAANSKTLALAFMMWVIMMAGMMLPSVAPMTLFYAAIVRKNRERGTALPAAWLFVSGYLLVWVGFGLGATMLQVLFEEMRLASPMLIVADRWLSSAILVGAGAYQWSPLKDKCLAQCRSPIRFITSHWHAGRLGALRMGVISGGYCFGCCWAIMLLLFVGGAMNLIWVAVITGFVLLEKVVPHGRLVSRITGLVLIGGGVFLLTSS
jgi:predicted metal-binding membrane protein